MLVVCAETEKQSQSYLLLPIRWMCFASNDISFHNTVFWEPANGDSKKRHVRTIPADTRDASVVLGILGMLAVNCVPNLKKLQIFYILVLVDPVVILIEAHFLPIDPGCGIILTIILR